MPLSIFLCVSLTQVHTGVRAFQCPHCPLTFKWSSHFQYHLRQHTGERPYVCKECGKSFKNTSCLRRHSQMHSGLRPHVCSICSKSFSQTSNLKQVSRASAMHRYTTFFGDCTEYVLFSLFCKFSVGSTNAPILEKDPFSAHIALNASHTHPIFSFTSEHTPQEKTSNAHTALRSLSCTRTCRGTSVPMAAAFPCLALVAKVKTEWL